MEPPLYAYLNKACLKLEVTELNTLGPYTRVMIEMLAWCTYSDGKRDDYLRMGKDDDDAEIGPYGRFSKCFITFRGVRMGIDM